MRARILSSGSVGDAFRGVGEDEVEVEDDEDATVEFLRIDWDARKVLRRIEHRDIEIRGWDASTQGL